MKKFLLLALLTASFLSVTAQKFVNRNADERFDKYLKTTDNTVRNIDSIITTANEAGVVTVELVGYNADSSAAVTGIKAFRYRVKSGTVTLSTISDITTTVTDAEISGATFAIAVVSNKIYIRVTGKAATTIHWRSVTKRKSIQRE